MNKYINEEVYIYTIIYTYICTYIHTYEILGFPYTCGDVAANLILQRKHDLSEGVCKTARSQD